MAANVSGAVLSSLFYDQTSCPGDQEGYLLGKIVSHVQDNISDSQISNCKVETIIYVYSYIPWPSEDKFYNASGRVDPTKAITLLKGRHQELIGWYRFRRNSTLRPSLRESNLHHSLLESLPVEQHDNFLFFLCSAGLSFNKSTHTFDHTLLRNHNGRFQKVTLSVTNLGDTTHMEYKSRMNLTVNPSGGSLRAVIDQYQPDFVGDSGNMHQIGKIRGISQTLHHKLQSLSSEVEVSEQELSALEEEVKLMSYRLMEQEESLKEKRRLQNQASSIHGNMADNEAHPVTTSLSHTLQDNLKLAGGRSEQRLRVSVGESTRRPRQISIDEDDVEKEEALRRSPGRSPESSIIDFDIRDHASNGDILQPVSSMDVDSSEHSVDRTSSKTVKLASVKEVAKEDSKPMPAKGGVVRKPSDDVKKNKPGDAFSFVSNILEKEKGGKQPVSSTASASHEVGKPTAKREMNTNNSNVSTTRRLHSKAEAQTARVRKTHIEAPADSGRVPSPSSRTRTSGPAQPSTSSEVKGERSRPQRVRSRPAPAVRSRSRESPPGAGQRLSSGIHNVSRTKSASPSNCRTPVRKVPCENGTDSSAMLDDSKLSSSPVF